MLILLWIVAGAFGLSAASLAVWAMFADRSRGRRRCPKCSHPVDPAIGMRCPECGREARNERQLFRTRRRWKLAIAAVLLLGGPALVAGGLARVKQTGGWADLPSWALARLTWLRDDKLDGEVLLRVGRGRFGDRQAGALVAEARHRLASSIAKEIDSGLALLNKFATNDVGYYPDFAKVRPRLEELDPRALAKDLMDLEARDPARLRDVAPLLGHLRDVSDEAVLWLLDRAHDERMRSLPQVWSALKTTINERDPGHSTRLPRPPRELGLGTFEMPTSRGPNSAALALTLTRAVRDARRDVEAVKEWARTSWEESIADETAWDAERIPQLWLWCRLDHFGQESFPDALAAAEHEDPAVSAYAVTLLAGYPWCEQTERVLGSLLTTGDGATASAALETARSFKSQASALLSVILERVSSPEGVIADGDFIGSMKTLGGSERDLRDAIVARLEKVYDTRLDEVMRDFRPTTNPFLHVDPDLERLAFFTEGSERAAALCMKYTSIGNSLPSDWAAVAYAAMSGDRTWATRFLLDKNPKLTEGLTYGTTPQAMLQLVMAGQSDAVLLTEHFLEADPNERVAFTQMLEGFVFDWKTLEPFLPYLRIIAADASNPTEQASANKSLDRYERYKGWDRE